MSGLFEGGLAQELIGLPVAVVAVFGVLVWGLVRWWTGRGGPGPILGGLGLLALVPVGLGLLLRLADDAHPEASRLLVVSYGALQMGGWAGPIQLLWLFGVVGAAAAWTSGERRWSGVGPVGLGALGAAVVVALGGQLHEDALFAGIRAGAYLFVGLPLALAGVSVGERGRQVVGWSAPALPVVVALGECGQRGLMQVLVAAQVPVVQRSDWVEAVDWFHLVSEPTARHATIALLVASAGALAALARAPSRLRWGGVGVVALAWLAWGLADGPIAREKALEPLCPEVVEPEAPPTSR